MDHLSRFAYLVRCQHCGAFGLLTCYNSSGAVRFGSSRLRLFLSAVNSWKKKRSSPKACGKRSRHFPGTTSAKVGEPSRESQPRATHRGSYRAWVENSLEPGSTPPFAIELEISNTLMVTYLNWSRSVTGEVLSQGSFKMFRVLRKGIDMPRQSNLEINRLGRKSNDLSNAMGRVGYSCVAAMTDISQVTRDKRWTERQPWDERMCVKVACNTANHFSKWIL